MESVTIRELGPRGDGIHIDARGRIYVDRSAPGDVLEVKTKPGPDNTTRGEIVRIVKSSPDRQDAPCKNYDQCGGCTLQHVTDSFYRNWKKNLVHEALERQGIETSKYEDPIFIAGGHRRRVTFAALKQKNGIVLGYYKRRSKFINDIDECMVADPAIMALRNDLKKYLAPVLKESRPIDVFIQKIGNVFDVVLTGQLGSKGKLDLSTHEMAANLIQNTPVVRVSWRSRSYDAIETIVEKEPFKIQFGALNVHLPPASFLQPTLAGEQALVISVMKHLPEQGRFADLFAGCGTFSGAMLACGSVDAYENNKDAMTALNKAAQGTKLKTCVRDLFHDPLSADELNHYDAVVFDPPRAGAKEQASMLASSNVRRVIGVSCNPATFARDARILIEGGYQLKNIQIVDQFIWSHHVEVIGLFTKT